MMTATRSAFDHPDRLNDDGTVTFRMVPSSWRRYNLSPDTYQLVNGESWEETELEYLSEQTGRELTYDDVEWDYDHAAIVRDFSEVLAEWISEQLMTLGLESLRDVTVVESWSPQFYNFTSDGFEVELTCDPAELRAITPEFDVDQWAGEWYGSVDGFASFIPGRMQEDEWRATYDAEFRVESLLASLDPRDEESWRFALYETEWEVYSRNVGVTIIEPEFMDSGYTLPELEEWARLLTPTQPETLA